MRTLLLMRGAPGSGKSTWIKQNGLENYVVSPDGIRMQLSSVGILPDGKRRIVADFKNEKKVWKIVFDMLEYRMTRGEFTVVDGTCSKTKDINQYKKLADKYKYRMFIVDFTDVPLETCIKQNKMRDEIKWVPNDRIENIYARFESQQVPSGVTVIKRNELNKIMDTPIDLSSYSKLVFIGDIHGCYDTLMQYPDFKEGLKPDVEYIFLGDFLDRGNQNAEVFKFIDSIKDLPNVCLLEGNHERWIKAWGVGDEIQSRVFRTKTLPQLTENGITDKQARMLYRKLRQYSHINYNGAEILACHGGIPNLDTNLLFVPTIYLIDGVGEYGDVELNAESWMTQTSPLTYLVHGHRNPGSVETQMQNRVFNLDGHVEFGGTLRIVEVDEQLHWNVIELEDCQEITEDLDTTERKIETVEDAVVYLRNNPLVEEKQFGNISSFNFSREAFNSRRWNKQTILARGLFINTETNTVALRSYEKFFNIGERRETELLALKNTLQFPVKAYLKYNGFLALVSYDRKKDELLVASKSSLEGDYVGYIRKVMKPIENRILDWFRMYDDNEEVTLIFECLDKDDDPHIIEYNYNSLVLLDVVKNKMEFESFDYDEVFKTSIKIGSGCKQLCKIFYNYDELKDFYNKIQDYEYKQEFVNGKDYVEGYVFEDSVGYKVKAKTEFYKEWKKLRGVAQSMMRCGLFLKTGQLTNSLENRFYGFLKKLYKEDEEYYKENGVHSFKTDIISLRNKFIFNQREEELENGN